MDPRMPYMSGLNIAVLVKQVPRFESMALGADGRLLRQGLDLELNPYCRRAVSKGVELAKGSQGRCTVITLGPESAEDCLREAVAWGADAGILVTDAAFAGSDTLATSRALAAAIRHQGPFDLVLAGRNSVDADTGQVAPQVAELLGLPFLAGVRTLEIDGVTAAVECEQDDGWLWAEVELPAVMSCAERLCDPAKVEPDRRALVSPASLRRLDASDLGPGPWGAAGSPTRVGEVKVVEVERRRLVLTGSAQEQVRTATQLLREAGALTRSAPGKAARVPDPTGSDGPVLAVLAEPGRPGVTRQLLGAAARLASSVGGTVQAVTAEPADGAELASWGADQLLQLENVVIEEDIAHTVAAWCHQQAPWAVLAPSTTWGREVASRVAARIGAGLTGDAVDVDVAHGQLVGWKPAFGGHVVVAITATSPTQMITVRPGVFSLLDPRSAGTPTLTRVIGKPESRVRHLDSARDDDLGDLAVAEVVVGVGAGVPPEEYPLIDPLLTALGAELAATRKVTDKHWLPHARQIGITGRSISPTIYVAIALSGKFNHMMGVRAAGLVVAINSDPSAPVFQFADIGIVADWREVLPHLVMEVSSAVPA
jgi:electron transfer flavoprotein alpha subunit